ncbi:sensor histidine kinase, partial [Polaribacter sp.]
DFKSSLEALQKANIYRDSIFTIEKNKAVLELEQKYQTEKKEKENLTLIQQTSEKDLTIAKKNNYLLFGSLLFITIILSLISYQLHKFKIKNNDLQNSINEREKIEKELEVVRDSIAKDFHDDLGNKLARISVLSEYMIHSVKNWNKSKITEALKKINLDADILYRGTRDFMFSLKAKSDYAEELFTYLSDFGEEFFHSLNIDFYVKKKLDINNKLPYYWNRQIILIFKEAMTNAAKHSYSNEVKLSMKIKNNDLNIIFEDNGIGFNFDEISTKNGLSNMQLRAQKINALLTISSTQNGTKIIFNAKITN